MSFNPDLEDEGYDINTANAAVAAEALQKLSSQNVSDKSLGEKSTFMAMLSKGFKTLVDKSLVGQTAKFLNKIAPSTWSNMTNKERWMARGARGFYRNEDGTWNVSNPFKIDPTTGQEATRKHTMVNIFGEEYPMGPPIEIDDTTPFMLEHFSRNEINPEMLAEKRRLWDLWLLTGQKQYLEQYHNEESNPKWA
jgi:hypothetical protein